jgi:histidyl-tRNA synthetase
MVSTLRNAGIAAELYLGESGMRAQLKYADRRNAPAVVIQGGDELARGVVQVKDLAVGKVAAAAITGHEQWKEERPGQVEVPEADLVEAVRRIVGG